MAEMENLIVDKGKVRDCPSNWAKLTWYQYGRHFGFRQVCWEVASGYKTAIKGICFGLYCIIGLTILIPLFVLVKPFLWHRRVIKARKK